MSRRKIKKGVHKKKPRGNYRKRNVSPLEIMQHQRKQKKKAEQSDENRMKRLGVESIKVEQEADYSLNIPPDCINERDVFSAMNPVGE